MARYDYIDIARGLGILAVIWGHIIWHHWTGDYVYTFHMPLFFFISGMLFHKEKYSSSHVFIKKRVKRLFVPYLWYSIITWMIWAGFNYFLHRPVDSYFAPLLQTFLAQGSGEFMVHNSPLWFIPCLFAVEVMYYFISKTKDILIILLCISLAGMSILLEHLYGEDYLLLLPWNFDAALMALPFYAAGNFLTRYLPHQTINNIVKQHQMLVWCIIITLTGLLVYSVQVFGSMSMGYSGYGNEYIFHIRAILGCISTLLFASLLSFYAQQHISHFFTRLINFIKWFGIVSLDVMCTHVPIKGFIIVAVATFLHQPRTDAMSNIWLALLVFVITLIIDSYVVSIIQIIKLKYKEYTSHKK